MIGNKNSEVNSAFIDYNNLLNKSQRLATSSKNPNKYSNLGKVFMDDYEAGLYGKTEPSNSGLRSNSLDIGYQNDDPDVNSKYNDYDEYEDVFENTNQKHQEIYSSRLKECINLTLPYYSIHNFETLMWLSRLKPLRQRKIRNEILEMILQYDFDEEASAGMRVISAMTNYLYKTGDVQGLHNFVKLVTELSKVLKSFFY